jgi:hypothetical protein
MRNSIIRYKEVIGVDAGQVVNKNDGAWNAFFELLKLGKQGKLPPFVKKLSPPGYWKDQEYRREEYTHTDQKRLILSRAY